MRDFLSQLKRLILIVGDIVLLYLTLWIALLLRYQGEPSTSLWQLHFWPFTVVFLLWLAGFYIAGLYDHRLAKSDINFYTNALRTILINAGIAVLFFYIFNNRLFSIRPQVVFGIFVGVYAILFLLWRRFYNQMVASATFLQNVLFIADGDELDELSQELYKKPYLGYKVVDTIRLNGQLKLGENNSEQKNMVDLKQELAKKNVHAVVTSLSLHHHPEIVAQFFENLSSGVSYFDMPKFYERLMGKVPVSTIGQLWFLENITENEKRFYEVSKRVFDILGAIVFGIVGIVLTPFIALVIKLDSRGPVVFKQRRVGKFGKTFLAMKFRSMRTDAENTGPQWTQFKDPRITGVGRFLRKTKLDEIPQLINILRGEMSFIGPRPEQPEFVDTLTQKLPYYRERHLVNPGLTGWAQIHLPYASASVEDTTVKLQYDLYYIKNRSFLLDVGIILKTINTVLSRQSR